ncbi:MAG: hypothetical protein ABI388_13240 [Bacteroidia bacterium]
MKNIIKRFALVCLFAVFVFSACNSPSDNLPIPESEYSTKIIGSWEGTVGEMKEIMILKPDCTFVCYVHSIGFIANTLSQSIPGDIYGKWLIKDAKINMEITGEKNERVENDNTSSLIVAFTLNRLVLKSNKGDSSVFNRVRN